MTEDDDVAAEAFWARYDTIGLRGGRLTLTLRGDVTPHRYRKISVPAEAANWTIGDGDSSPEEIWSVLWAYFAENYAFFGERGIDWGATRERVLAQLSPGMSDDALFQLLQATLAPLEDAHVKLFAGERQYHAFKPAFTAGREELSRVLGYDKRDWRGEGIARLSALIGEALQDGGHSSPNKLVCWGLVDPASGYLAVHSMWGHGGPESDAAADVEVIEPLLDQAFADLPGIERLVLDLRFNGGGQDAVALAIGSRLVSGHQLAFSKRAVDGSGYGEETRLYFNRGAKPGFDGPLVVLTSALTASASENLIIGFESRPRKMVIGEATAGALSDVLWKMLPNGWCVGVSNEIFRSPSGFLYEGPGVRLDREVPTFPLSGDARRLVEPIRAAAVLGAHL